MKRQKHIKAADKNGSNRPEAFDIWLKRGLDQIYGDIAKEPIPEDLLKLIEDDAKK